jgi:uncharacterized membrane protein YphA (DoxX/SURF4 family)
MEHEPMSTAETETHERARHAAPEATVRHESLPAELALRIAAALTFGVSGAVKLLFENQGAARFAKLGIFAPRLMAPMVSAVEVLGALMLVAGVQVEWASAALATDMLVAISTKVPLLWGAAREPMAAAPQTGLFAFLYAARLDLTMLLLCAGAFAGARGRKGAHSGASGSPVAGGA